MLAHPTQLSFGLQKASSRAYHSLADLRRQKIKSLIKPWDTTSDSWYTDHRLGNDLTFNLALSAHRVSPRKESFRNLHPRGLLQFSKEQIDNTKAVHRESSLDAVEFHVLDGTNPAIEAQYRKVFPEARLKIGRSNLFTRDCAVGAHHWAEVPVRVMTDSPSLDLALSHLLPSVPLRAPKEQPISLLVYIATTLQKTSVGGADNYSVFDAKNNRLLIVGKVSASAARDAITRAASTVYSKASQDGLLLNADTVKVNGKNLLVFSNDLLHNKNYAVDFVSAHNTFWTSKGVVRAFNGVSSSESSSVPKYAVVDQVKNKKTVTYPTKGASTGESPSSIVFLTEDTKGVLPTISKLNTSQTEQFFLAGYNGTRFSPFFGNPYATINPSQVLDRFKELSQKIAGSAYVVNTSNLTPEETSKIFSSIADGSASKAPTSDGYNILMPISSLPGFTKISVKGQTESGKFEQEFTQFIKKNFPSVQQ